VKALVRPLRRIKDGEQLTLEGGGTLKMWRSEGGLAEVLLDADPAEVMATQGEMPLPPYFHREALPEDTERYQTVYASPLGSAAAPTAGLHFTSELIADLRQRGVGFSTVTLHVGLGTFKPLTDAAISSGELHEEAWSVPLDTANAIASTRAAGGRVIAVGTTATRALESATPMGGHLPALGSGQTRLFIRPGYSFRSIDGLITNFHLPRSSLLMLVGAMTGRERLLEAYAHAVDSGYRFYSYGDAMLIL
jgi:S-adenosylmethionine:tRNA ribosyltransferase-isomerase